MSGNYTSIDNQSVSGSVPAVSSPISLIHKFIRISIQVHLAHQSRLILQAVPDPGHHTVKFEGQIPFPVHHFLELLSFCFAVRLKQKENEIEFDIGRISWILYLFLLNLHFAI